MPRDGSAVLIVDDDRINRALLSKLLEHEGYRARTAVNGREALAALGEERFDAVLLDIVMPEVDGLEVLRTVKTDPRLWHIPVIVISGLEETESIVSCLELGADDYVQKPFDPVLLRARLNACLARRQFHDLEVEYQKMLQEQAAELQELKSNADGATGDMVPAGIDMQARRAPVAVLDVGLGALDDLAEEGDPTVAVAIVDAFQATVGALAARFGGAVSARAADALTVVFRGPRPCPDPVAAGLGMAVALDDEMTALLAGWVDGDHPSATWGAGLAVGDATVGMVGQSGSRQVAAVGSVVARAGHLRDLGRGQGAVVLDEGSFGATQRMSPGDGLDAQLMEEAGDATTPAYRLQRRRPHTAGGEPPGPGPINAG